MSPYRTPPAPDLGEERDDARRDDRVLAFGLLLIGGIRVALALALHEVFGAESTIALVMVVVGIVLLLRRS